MSVTLYTFVTPLLGGTPVRRKISLDSFEDFVCLEEAMGQVSFLTLGSCLELSGSDLRLAEAVRNKESFVVPAGFYDEDAEEIAVLFRLTSKIRRRLEAISDSIAQGVSSSKNS